MKIFYSPGEEGGGPPTPEDEEYLSNLANAVLGKKPFPYKQRVAGKDRDPVRPSGATPKPKEERRSGSSSAVPTPPSARQEPPQRRSGSSTAVPVPPSAQGQAQTTPRPATPQAARRVTPHPVASAEGWTPGTILLFEDDSIGVYKETRPDKDYDVILLLGQDSAVRPQGVALQHYEVEPIGLLPPDFLHRIQRRKTWERDEIVYHLSAFDFCRYVPHPDGDAPEVQERRESAPTSSGETNVSGIFRKPGVTSEEDPKRLIPGRRLTITFGPNQEWNAVFMGEDDLGTVIAHRTNEKWALMHLDLRRFKDSTVLGDMVSPEEMKNIRDDVAASQ